MPNEPSMEEILSSIKRIIADEDRGHAPRAPRRGAGTDSVQRLAPPPADESASPAGEVAEEAVLELTEALPDEPARLEEPMSEAVRAEPKPARTEPRAETRTEPRGEAKSARGEPRPARAQAVLSETSAMAARESLDHLSKLLVRSEEGQSNTLEGLVREMLRPMLKDWLDAHLPDLVETMVKREIDRITGRV